MGRPELPVPRPDRASGSLALGLRAARHRAGITNKELAVTTAFSRQTLQRAASGRGVPDIAVVKAYAQGCGADPEPLLALWKKARIEKEQHRRGRLSSAAPNVRQIRDEADLGAALNRLHVQAGAPTCRDVEKRTAKAEGVVKIPKTTAHLFITRQRIPRSAEQMRALLFAYNIAPASQGPWLKAWNRVERHLDSERAKKTREQEAHRGPARARRNRLEQLLTTATRIPGTQTYLQDAHQSRRRRRRPATLKTVTAGETPPPAAPPASPDTPAG